jgi:hypothetical protein
MALVEAVESPGVAAGVGEHEFFVGGRRHP